MNKKILYNNGKHNPASARILLRSDNPHDRKLWGSGAKPLTR